MSSKNPEHRNNPEQSAESHSDTTEKQIGSSILKDVIHSPEKQAEEYIQKIEQILSKPLTPETFDGYADNALNEVISVADSMIATYLEKRGLSDMPINGKVADNLVESYGISIDEILNNLESKSDEISKIQKSVESINKDHKIYIPPDSEDFEFKNGEAEFTPKEVVPKIETILFMLQQNYELSVDNPKDIKLISGTVSHDMMRREPYVLIDIPSLNRIILACNEKGNITYVFDHDKIKQAEIPLEKLVDYTKKQLDEILKDFENIGIRIRHTSKYLPKIDEALNSIQHFAKMGEKRIEDNPDIHDPTLLKKIEKAPEGVLSMGGIAKDLGVADKKIKSIIEENGEELGSVSKYKFGSRTAKGYTPEQVEIIKKHLGPIAPLAPEGILSTRGAAIKLDVDKSIIKKIIEELEGKLGEVGSYRFGPNTAKGYTPEQVEIMRKHLGTKAPPAPEGVLSKKGAAELLNSTRYIIDNIVEELGEELGEVESYRFGVVKAEGYTPEQIEIIRKHLGPVAPPAPEGVLSMRGIAKDLGVDFYTIKRVVKEFGEELGEVNIFSFGFRKAKGYTPEQVEIIKKHLGPIAPLAPEGILSAVHAAKDLGVADKKIKSIVEEIGEELGEVGIYRFGPQTTKGYTPKQIEIMKKHLGPIAPLAPEGVLSTNGVAKDLGVDFYTIKRVAKELGEELGEVKRYKFGPTTADGYTPEQIDIIKREIGKEKKK